MVGFNLGMLFCGTIVVTCRTAGLNGFGFRRASVSGMALMRGIPFDAAGGSATAPPSRMSTYSENVWIGIPVSPSSYSPDKDDLIQS